MRGESDMAINAEWVVNNDGDRIYAVTHSKAAVRGSSTVDADLSSMESRASIVTSNITTANNEITTVNGRLSTISGLQTRLNTANSNISSANSSISSITNTNTTNVNNTSTISSNLSSMSGNLLKTLSLSGNTLSGLNAAGTSKSSVVLNTSSSDFKIDCEPIISTDWQDAINGTKEVVVDTGRLSNSSVKIVLIWMGWSLNKDNHMDDCVLQGRIIPKNRIASETNAKTFFFTYGDWYAGMRYGSSKCVFSFTTSNGSGSWWIVGVNQVYLVEV